MVYWLEEMTVVTALAPVPVSSETTTWDGSSGVCVKLSVSVPDETANVSLAEVLGVMVMVEPAGVEIFNRSATVSEKSVITSVKVVELPVAKLMSALTAPPSVTGEPEEDGNRV